MHRRLQFEAGLQAIFLALLVITATNEQIHSAHKSMDTVARVSASVNAEKILYFIGNE